MPAIDHAAETMLPVEGTWTGTMDTAQELKLPQAVRCKVSIYPVTNDAFWSVTGAQDDPLTSGRPLIADAYNEIANGAVGHPRGRPSIFVASATDGTVFHYVIEGV